MIQLSQGDITQFSVDAIVNGANSLLVPGGGVSSAIHRFGGPEIDNECAEWRDNHGLVKPGTAAITTAGDLHALCVIHAVGPVWTGGIADEATVLADTYRAAMQLADERGLTSIAFPSLSTGVFGYPIDQAAPVAIDTLREAIRSSRSVKDVTVVLFDQETYDTYEQALHESLSPT